MAKFIIGGRLGDAIHQLYVVKNTPGVHDLYITDDRSLHSDGFLYSLEKTVEELKPVLMYQDYVNSVQVYTGPVTENVTNRDGFVVADEDEYINLNMWRRKAYSANWSVLLSEMFGFPVSGERWLVAPEAQKYNKLVHCSIPEARRGNWDGVNLSGCAFIGSLQEYENFRRPELPNIVPHSLRQMIALIGSCNHFTGNQSLPLAISHALDIPRIAVLNPVDAKAYMGEEKIFKNFSYVL